MSRLYLSPPDVGPADRALLLEAFDSGWIAPAGPFLEAFEAELARRTGVPGALALSSGTAALHLALLLAGVEPGDQVVVPTLTFVATANVVRYVGAEPVFVDSEPSTWQLDPELVQQALEDAASRGRPGAVISVDLYGQAADYDRLSAVCERYGVPLIEDAAEALGATYRGRPAGSFGRAGVLSFNGNKIITSSSGGALVSHSPDLLARARHLSTQAREPEVHYQHVDMGFNYRMSNLLAALGLAQLRDLDRRLARRRAIRSRYHEALSRLPGISLMPVAGYGEPNCWLTCILVDPEEFGATRDDIRRNLEDSDIESRPTWKPMHLQPLYMGAPMFGGAVSESIFARGLCLPSGSSLSDAEQDRVIEGILSSAP